MKIRTWHFSFNNYVDWKIGDIHCIERPLWVHLGSWFVESVISRGCCLFHWIKFPDWPKIQRDGFTYTIDEYYGDLGSMYHYWVFNPIFQWWWKVESKNQKEWEVHIGYDKLLEVFGKDFKELEPVYGDKTE